MKLTKFKDHNQRGIFLFQCPRVFMCPVLLYRHLISCKCSIQSIQKKENLFKKGRICEVCRIISSDVTEGIPTGIPH